MGVVTTRIFRSKAPTRSSSMSAGTSPAPGRVDSPPTLHQGRAIFGCRDGYVYCLTADDGKLVWRFRAAPIDQRISLAAGPIIDHRCHTFLQEPVGNGGTKQPQPNHSHSFSHALAID